MNEITGPTQQTKRDLITDAGEDLVEKIESEASGDDGGDDTNREKIESLAEIVCRGGEEASGALFVLTGTMQNSKESVT